MSAVKETTAAGLPALCEEGHVLVTSYTYVPAPNALSVVMHNLLSRFDPRSYSIVTARTADTVASASRTEAQVHRIMSNIGFSQRLNQMWLDWQLPGAVARTVRLIQQTEARVLFGVFPNYYFLRIAREAAKKAAIPWIPYLHDTVAEGQKHTRLGARAAQLQEQVFAEASRICVMSQGMADLYQRKYNLVTQPLVHTYPEPIPTEPPSDPPLRQAFWSGSVYVINQHAVARVVEALRRIDCPCQLTTTNTRSHLEQMGVPTDHLKVDFYPKRSDYLQVLQQQGLLILALDWPEETRAHEDELSTIFPTKTPEYLAAGRPILAHCPEHYFLARFIREHRCGLVVSERSVDALAEACRFLLSGSAEVGEMTRRALQAARIFEADRVAAIFQDEVQRVAKARWGERVS